MSWFSVALGVWMRDIPPNPDICGRVGSFLAISRDVDLIPSSSRYIEKSKLELAIENIIRPYNCRLLVCQAYERGHLGLIYECKKIAIVIGYEKEEPISNIIFNSTRYFLDSGKKVVLIKLNYSNIEEVINKLPRLLSERGRIIVSENSILEYLKKIDPVIFNSTINNLAKCYLILLVGIMIFSKIYRTFKNRIFS